MDYEEGLSGNYVMGDITRRERARLADGRTEHLHLDLPPEDWLARLFFSRSFFSFCHFGTEYG